MGVRVARYVNRNLYRAGIKRAVDIIGGSVLLLLCSPVLLIGWLGVRLTSRGPGVFAQERVGRGGRTVVMYKLRSMCLDGDARIDLEAVKEGEAKGELYKPQDDPRITGWGRFIRKTSIDELPQLWNVVRGDMSLVGPRPLVPHMLAPFPGIKEERCRVRPGITGQWQISARTDNTTVLAMVDHDLEYIENLSMLNDFRILVKTPLAVLRMTGAH